MEGEWWPEGVAGTLTLTWAGPRVWLWLGSAAGQAVGQEVQCLGGVHVQNWGEVGHPGVSTDGGCQSEGLGSAVLAWGEQLPLKADNLPQTLLCSGFASIISCVLGLL